MRKIFGILAVAVALATFTTPAYSLDDSGFAAAVSMQKAMVNVARSMKQSVVNIRIEKSQKVSNGFFNFDSDGENSDEAEEFFRKFFRMPRGNGAPKEEKVVGGGSGIIFKEDGTILTNNHVVKGASKITVTVDDEHKYEAKIIGSDENADIVGRISKFERKCPMIEKRGALKH